MEYRDIASHVEEIYDHKISVIEISSIIDKLLAVINEWRHRQSVYPIVFMDGMCFEIKELHKQMYVQYIGYRLKQQKRSAGFLFSKK